MASMQTRLAQGAARDAETRWKQHAGNCAPCSNAIRHRYVSAQPCSAGADLLNERCHLAAEARREAELDQQPPANMDPLF